MAQSPEYELTYFNGRGIAETARYLFALAEKDFTDTRFPIKVVDWKTYQFERKEFDKAKSSGQLKLSLGKVPFLTVGGTTVIPQSKAIERFLARRFGLLGSSDTDAALIDAFAEHCRDVKTAYQPVRKAVGEEKAKLLEIFFNVDLPGRFRAMAAARERGEWIVGDALSLADVSFYELIEFFDDQSRARKSLSSSPDLEQIWWNFKHLKVVQRWEEERPETPF